MRYFGRPTLETKVEKHSAVVFLHGKVTTAVEDVKLRETIVELLDRGITNIVIDLEDVPAIDSGIRELVAACSAVSKQGGHLELRHLPPKV